MQKIMQRNHLHDWFTDDARFHHLFPVHIQKRARRHWTPLEVAKYASEFLVPESGAKVLDIGSGVGTFCLSAAYYRPNGLFHGIEQRKELTDYALQAKHELGLANVFFIHGNFTQLDLGQYNHFYFFNSFYENLEGTEKIDHTIEYSSSLYTYYNRYLYKQLEQMPDGTRIATFHSLEEEIPPCYYVVKTHFEGLLKFWIKYD